METIILIILLVGLASFGAIVECKSNDLDRRIRELERKKILVEFKEALKEID